MHWSRLISAASPLAEDDPDLKLTITGLAARIRMDKSLVRSA